MRARVPSSIPAARRRGASRAGLTLVELIVAFSILLVLSTMALPLTKMKVQREKERRLRMALEEVRTAIDRYKDASDKGLLGEQDPDNHGYPESLDILVEGVEVNNTAGGAGAMGMGMGQQGGMGGGMQQGGLGGRSGSSMGNRSSSFGGSNRGSSFGGGGSSFGGGNSSFGSRKSGGFGGSSSSRMKNSTAGRFGESSGAGEDDDEPKTMRFLRKIPVDPITGRADWGMRSVSDSPDSMSWGGGNVFDVFSLSMDTALDGTRYSDW
ncbi:MAG: hypothetical protein GC160_16680 [Acidobacteria bacterium]|nr:hypothetical protein [Acidobacteriota bacterium]